MSAISPKELEKAMKRLENETEQENDFDELACEQAMLIIDNRTPEEKENGFCPVCREHKTTVQCRKQNTAYVEDIYNFVIMCDECFEDNEAYWKERWDELYSDIHAGIAAGNLADRM